MKISNSIFVIFLLTSATFSTFAQVQNEDGGVLAQTQKNENQGLGEQVRYAFEASKKGDYTPVTKLKEFGVAIIPFLKPYQDDVNSDVRSRVIWLLKHIAEPDSIPLLSKALIDKDKNVSLDAARTLYEYYPPSLFENNAKVGANLRQSVAAGRVPTASLVLLAYFPHAETVRTLKAVAEKKGESVNLSFNRFPMVKPSIAANVSLSHLGDAGGDDALSSKIKIGEQNDLEFLLNAVDLINNKRILRELFQKTIDNATVIQPIKDGKYRSSGNLWRMKDLSVKKLTEKLNISFRPKNERLMRYKNVEINLYKQKIVDALAQL